jgi:hypothetical protein
VSFTAPTHQDGASKTVYTRLADPRWYLTITEKRPSASFRVRASIALRRINAAAWHNNDFNLAHKFNSSRRKSVVESADLWTVLRTSGLAVDNDEAVIHRARLCPQAPQAPNQY